MRRHVRRMRPTDLNRARDLLLWFTAPPPSETVAEWCAGQVVFDEPEVKGPFDLTGRAYMVQPLNDNADPAVSKVTMVWGTGLGKTICFICGALWKIVHRQPRGLWVMPSTMGANGTANFANSRMIPAIKASPALLEKFPKDRHKVGGTKIHMNGAVIDFAGANSAGQLSGNRCSDVRCDEVDKFPPNLKDEAGSVHQAETRADGVIGAQIFISSTPSIETKASWTNLMASNLMRRFIPCPRCGRSDPSKNFVMIWNDQYCVLPPKFPDGRLIPVAKIKWDDTARRRDGSWDMDHVVRSARAICPHCGGDVVDSDMEWCDANGLWIPTRPSSDANKHQGYHLPAMYAPRRDFKSSFGGLAKNFLEAKSSTDGMRGFINSKLAEVDSAQEFGGNRIEISSTPISQPDWVPLLTADFHKNHPYIWFVVRKWCAFKLLPPFPIVEGKPDFMKLLDAPENAPAKARAESLVAGCAAAWPVFGELMRFASLKENDPVTSFLLSQKITGEKLITLSVEKGADFRGTIYAAMGIRMPKGGDSELLAAGNLDTSEQRLWDDVKVLVRQFEIGKGMPIPNRCVGIDCGYAEKFNREVLRRCFEAGTEFNFYDPTITTPLPVFFPQPRHNFCLVNPSNSWYAIRGVPVMKPMGKSKINHEIGLTVSDPFYGSAEAGTRVVETIEVPTGLFWLRKEDIRQGRTKHAYSISPDVSWFPKIGRPDGTATGESNFRFEDYERQVNEQRYDEDKGMVVPKHSRGGKSSRTHPYHLDDCETYQVALATHHEFFQQETKPKE